MHDTGQKVRESFVEKAERERNIVPVVFEAVEVDEDRCWKQSSEGVGGGGG